MRCFNAAISRREPYSRTLPKLSRSYTFVMLQGTKSADGFNSGAILIGRKKEKFDRSYR